MIFASDLDHTLIHPVRTLAADAWPNVTIVEHLDGKPLSYVPNRALELLVELAAETVFVPVTSRSREQLARVDRLVDLAGPVICANGAVILSDGIPDPVWEAQLGVALTAAASLAEAAAALELALGSAASDHWLLRSYTCDDAYWYGICDLSRTPPDVVDRTTATLDPLGWRAVLHGRKLYALPRPVSKEAALTHLIRTRAIPGPLVCAGDSVLDAGMLEMADIALAPADSPVAGAVATLKLFPGAPTTATPELVLAAAAAEACDNDGDATVSGRPL